MKVKISLHELIEDNASTYDGNLQVNAQIDLEDLFGSIPDGQEIDVHDLLAEQHAIALIWDAEQVRMHYEHLTEEQAWEVLQECERNYRGEEGLCWDDIAEVVSDLFPEPVKTNTNCLEGIACPKCGNLTRMHIDARTMAMVTDDGAEAFGDMEWDGDSYAECPECRYRGKLKEFRIEPETMPETQTEKE